MINLSKMLDTSNIVGTVVSGSAGIASTTALGTTSASESVQIITIICSCVIAITHIIFGYLMWRNSQIIKSKTP